MIETNKTPLFVVVSIIQVQTDLFLILSAISLQRIYSVDLTQKRNPPCQVNRLHLSKYE